MSTPHLFGAGIDAIPAMRQVREPRRARRLVRILILALGLLVAGLVLLPWQQTAYGSGRVVAFSPVERRQFLEAPIEGRIVRWWVREGTRVEEGEPVFEISDNDPELMERLEDERRAVDARLVAARVRAEAVTSRRGNLEKSREQAIVAAEARTSMALDRVAQARKGLEAASAGYETARLQLERQAALTQQGLTSRRTLELAELDEARASADLERARSALSAAESEARALAGDRGRTGTDAAASIDDAKASYAVALAEVAAASVEIARLEVRLARQKSQLVTAPRKGTVLRIVAAQGAEMVKSGDPVALFVPDTDARSVELFVDGNDIPLIAEGRAVRLQFEGWPALQFAGAPDVAVGTFPGRVSVIDAADDGKGRFRVLIVPDRPEQWPSAQFLRQGLRAHGWVLLEVVPLGYELWRTFNGLPPDVPADSPASSLTAK